MVRKGLVLLVLAAVTIGAAQTAMAVAWGPLSSYYNNIKRVTGWGDFYNEGFAYATNKITVRDDSNDGNTVYGRSLHQFWKWNNLQGTETWHGSTFMATPEFSNTTRTYYHKKGLDSQASKARVQTKACAQMGWPVPDSCTSTAYPSFNY